MTKITLSSPGELEVGDRVFIDGRFAYEVIERPTVAFPAGGPDVPPLNVPIRYADGGASTRTFEADVSWDGANIVVER